MPFVCACSTTVQQFEEARRYVLDRVIAGDLQLVQAAEILSVSTRHAWRLLAAYRARGAAALAHGNRRRRPHNAVPADLLERVAREPPVSLIIREQARTYAVNSEGVAVAAGVRGVRRCPSRPRILWDLDLQAAVVAGTPDLDLEAGTAAVRVARARLASAPRSAISQNDPRLIRRIG